MFRASAINKKCARLLNEVVKVNKIRLEVYTEFPRQPGLRIRLRSDSHPDFCYDGKNFTNYLYCIFLGKSLLEARQTKILEIELHAPSSPVELDSLKQLSACGQMVADVFSNYEIHLECPSEGPAKLFSQRASFYTPFISQVRRLVVERKLLKYFAGLAVDFLEVKSRFDTTNWDFGSLFNINAKTYQCYLFKLHHFCHGGFEIQPQTKEFYCNMDASVKTSDVMLKNILTSIETTMPNLNLLNLYFFVKPSSAHRDWTEKYTKMTNNIINTINFMAEHARFPIMIRGKIVVANRDRDLIVGLLQKEFPTMTKFLRYYNNIGMAYRCNDVYVNLNLPKY
ncbi:unnamed protein product [Bursaphelenchus okinawaensis]|uniref:Uncharacterized protein n=1 Tax=Bursaphelenchus okinawaensis TaxID=465554 RepID=A0A811K913_9BILA|nr:unnamed protein product [Bursaphelenchus okinawaensis]CAG9097005.1 unnamed protein product [Bursaphelenchus okinawaensis]